MKIDLGKKIFLVPSVINLYLFDATMSEKNIYILKIFYFLDNLSHLRKLLRKLLLF